MLNKEKLLIVAAWLKKERLKKENKGETFPTDADVIACVEVFYSLIDIGNILGLEMLTAWAITRYSHYNGIASARSITHRVNLNTGENPVSKSGVSAHWVLNQLAGMHFTNKNGKDAHDYLKEQLKAQGFIS